MLYFFLYFFVSSIWFSPTFIIEPQISIEYHLGSILYFKPEGVTIADLNIFEQSVYNQTSDLILDVSRSAIIAVLESYAEYFKFENDILRLSNFYLNNMERIKSRYVDVLDGSIMENMQAALISI